jgi:hypothetical protein
MFDVLIKVLTPSSDTDNMSSTTAATEGAHDNDKAKTLELACRASADLFPTRRKKKSNDNDNETNAATTTTAVVAAWQQAHSRRILLSLDGSVPSRTISDTVDSSYRTSFVFKRLTSHSHTPYQRQEDF